MEKDFNCSLKEIKETEFSLVTEKEVRMRMMGVA